jgi:hypothetical protein
MEERRKMERKKGRRRDQPAMKVQPLELRKEALTLDRG